jgi:hypothetical protein
MPYNSTGEVSRPELSQFLEESAKADKFFIASQVMPLITVPGRAGRFPRIKRDKGELLKHGSTMRAPTGGYPEISRATEWDTYQCVERGTEERLDDSLTAEMASFYSSERLTSKLLMRYLLLDYEKRVADTVFDNSTFNATNSAVAYTEANLATIDFAKDLMDAKERMQRKAEEPNTLILSQQVWNRIRRSTKLQTFLYGSLGSGTQYRLIAPTDVGAAFDIPNTIIAAATYDTAKKGQTPTLSPIWSNSYVAVANVQSGDFVSGGLGRTLSWAADSPGGLFTTESYRDDKRRSDMIRVRTNSVEKVLDDGSCELITTQWA